MIVSIRLDDTYRIYDFYTDIPLLAGDLVVCDTRLGYTVGTVVATYVKSKKANRWVVQKIDVQGHLKRLEKIINQGVH